MDIYPTHVYILTMFQISFDSKKWSLTLPFICFLSNILEHSRTMSFTTLICIKEKNDNILNRLSTNVNMNLSYMTFIYSSLLPSWISWPPNSRCPYCFNMFTTFCQPQWYCPIFNFGIPTSSLKWVGTINILVKWMLKTNCY